MAWLRMDPPPVRPRPQQLGFVAELLTAASGLVAPFGTVLAAREDRKAAKSQQKFDAGEAAKSAELQRQLSEEAARQAEANRQAALTRSQVTSATVQRIVPYVAAAAVLGTSALVLSAVLKRRRK